MKGTMRKIVHLVDMLLQVELPERPDLMLPLCTCLMVPVRRITAPASAPVLQS